VEYLLYRNFRRNVVEGWWYEIAAWAAVSRVCHGTPNHKYNLTGCRLVPIYRTRISMAGELHFELGLAAGYYSLSGLSSSGFTSVAPLHLAEDSPLRHLPPPDDQCDYR